jgi:hypothetical protein
MYQKIAECLILAAAALAVCLGVMSVCPILWRAAGPEREERLRQYVLQEEWLRPAGWQRFGVWMPAEGRLLQVRTGRQTTLLVRDGRGWFFPDGTPYTAIVGRWRYAAP